MYETLMRQNKQNAFDLCIKIWNQKKTFCTMGLQNASLDFTTNLNRISRLGISQAQKEKKKLFHFCFWGRDALKKTRIHEEVE